MAFRIDDESGHPRMTPSDLLPRRSVLQLGAGATALGALALTTGCGSSSASAPARALRIAQKSEPTGLDPHLESGLEGMNVLINIFDTLTMRGVDNELVPRLATSWESVDEHRWRFRLREDVTFHNGGPSLVTVIAVLGITGWVSYARVLRSEVLSLRTREFVEAARVMGVPAHRIMARHMLPNVAGPLATILTLQVGTVILAEAALSFLGLGIPATIATWGSMLADGQLYMGTAWWLAVLPGTALLLTVLSINIAGDAVRDRWDPRTYTS